MKMIMMFVDADHAADVERLFEECDVTGYSEIANVSGKGTTGKKLGNRAFPGSSTLYVAALDDECEGPLRARPRGRSQGLFSERNGARMKMQLMIRRIAGTFVLASLALGFWVSPYWYLFTAFVGLNLVQSSFTRWCLMEVFLERLGIAKREA